jgi:hypothetical protein
MGIEHVRSLQTSDIDARANVSLHNSSHSAKGASADVGSWMTFWHERDLLVDRSLPQTDNCNQLTDIA